MLSMFSNIFNTTNSTTNSTEIAPEMTENPFLKWVHIVSNSVICLIGVSGNFMVILASRKPDMITVSNALIANLAVADFTVCLLNVPITAVYSYLGYWPFGAVLCKIIPLLLGLGLFASIGTLVLIAGERYWHIVLYTRRRLTICEAFKAITVIWVSSLVFFLPMAMFYKLTLSKKGQTEVSMCIEEWPSNKSRQAFTTLMFLLLYFFPLLLISGLYVKIGRFLRSLPATQQGMPRLTFFFNFVVVFFLQQLLLLLSTKTVDQFPLLFFAY